VRALRVWLGIVLVGCGGGVPDGGAVETHPKIVVSPLKLDFGLITTASATKTVTIENTGDGPLKLGKLELSSPVQFGLTLRDDSKEIAAGAKAEVDVRFTPSGYGPRAATLKFPSNDVEVTVALSGETTAPDACEFAVAPKTLAFGSIAAAMTKELSFTITATKGTCALTSAGLTASSNPAFTLPEGAIAARMLAAGESITIAVRAKAPLVSGSFMGSVLVLFEGQSQTSVALTATTVTGDCLKLAPNNWGFGSILVSCTSQAKSISISNVCADAVTIDSVAITCPTAACTDVTIAAATPLPAGTVIGPAGSPPRVLQLRYAPAQSGPLSARLTLRSTQYAAAIDTLLTINGEGEPLTRLVEDFIENPPLKRDLLFVINNSAAMGALQANTLTNLGLAFDAMAASDAQFAVTTIDATNGGRIIGDATNPKLITPSVTNAKAKFLQKFSQMPVTIEVPQPLAVIVSAISPAALAGDNAGLLRAGASHTVVLVTNEDDQSPLPVANYIPDLQPVFLDVVSRFGGSTCGSVSPLLRRLGDVVAATPSRTADLCDSTWSGLFGLIINPFPPRTRFFLSDPPNPASITVTLNGAALPATSSTWKFDPIEQAVIFDPAFPITPGPGASTIVISYDPACP